MSRTANAIVFVFGLSVLPSSVHAQETPTGSGPDRPPLRSAPSGEEVRFDPDTSGLTLLRQTGMTPKVYVQRWSIYSDRPAPVYAPLCSGPCDTRLPAGQYRFALARPGQAPLASKEPVRIDGPSELRGKYVDRSAIRTTGAVVAIAGPLGGLGMILAGTRDGGGNVCGESGNCFDFGDDNSKALRAGGAAVVVATLVVGSVLMMQDDRARFEVVPLTLAPVARREPGRWMAGESSAPQGAAVQWRF